MFLFRLTQQSTDIDILSCSFFSIQTTRRQESRNRSRRVQAAAQARAAPFSSKYYVKLRIAFVVGDLGLLFLFVQSTFKCFCRALSLAPRPSKQRSSFEAPACMNRWVQTHCFCLLRLFLRLQQASDTQQLENFQRLISLHRQNPRSLERRGFT